MNTTEEGNMGGGHRNMLPVVWLVQEVFGFCMGFVFVHVTQAVKSSTEVLVETSKSSATAS